MRTPWGESDYDDQVAEGVVSVSTPSHGGILVAKAVAEATLSRDAWAIGQEFGLWLAFEEDCAWAAVAYEHPEWFVGIWTNAPSEERIKMLASETLARWYPEYRGEER